jgi:hypothetical protein
VREGSTRKRIPHVTVCGECAKCDANEFRHPAWVTYRQWFDSGPGHHSNELIAVLAKALGVGPDVDASSETQAQNSAARSWRAGTAPSRPAPTDC